MSARSRARIAAILAVALAAATALLMGAVPASPAAASHDPAYTVTIGRKGPWTHPDDSPAAAFTDKDGSFHYQSAHALYGADDPREWVFSSGTDFDKATRDAGLSEAADPTDPRDRNDDTTWRCDNSPTGREATAPPAGSRYARKNYCDLMGVWVDPDTGDWIGLVHNEFTPDPFGDGLHYDAIDYAVSTDQGHTWDIKDHVLTSPYSTRRGDTGTFGHETYYYGDGDPRLFVDTASGYFYVYYNSRVIPKGGVPGGWTDGSRAHVARAPMSAKMAPGSWRKWYDGSWSQPGLGGLESNMEPVDAGHTTGYTSVAHDYRPENAGTVKQQQDAGLLPAKSDLLTMNIAYDAYLGLYIGQPEALTQDSGEPQRFYATDDLSTQKWRLLGDSGTYLSGSWYRWVLDPVNRTNSTIIGKTFRSYCSFQCSGGADGEYYDTTITTGSPAAVVTTGRPTTIRSGTGRLLAQTTGTSGTTSLPAGSTSARAQWVFTADGDGSYRITNAATGGLLGVDSTRDEGRAWGAKPTVTASPAAGPSAGRQWFVVPGRDSRGHATGTVRLVNRYSGLVLGLSGNPGRLAETTPTRAWTDRGGSAVGGSRTAAEQTLTLSTARPH